MRVIAAGLAAVALLGCTGDSSADRTATTRPAAPASSLTRVTHLGAAFDVPADLPVDEDYLAFACGGNPAPGVFLGVGYGFCPFSQLQNEPPGPSIYVGPYYQEADESRRELTSPTPLPDDVRPRPGAEIIEEQGQLVRWVTADSTVFPELNLEFRFVGVDDDLRSAVVGSVTPTR